MKLLTKPLFTGFAPNLTWQDFRTACYFLLCPWQWRFLRKGQEVEKAVSWLKQFFGMKYSFLFDSGRTALFYSLKALGAKEGVDVLVQAYTCMVVSNAINWTGASPVYVDVRDDFNMDADDLTKKISSRAKILIIQHTFGRPSDLEKLLVIAKEHNLKVIEDCAHAFGGSYKDRLLGSFADIGMFSFGADKTVSCVRGGGVVTNNEEIGMRLKEYHSQLPLTRRFKVFQHLLHCIVFAISKPLYNLGIGKCFLILAKKIYLISRIMYRPEKHGKQVTFYPALLPNALAMILLHQFADLEKTNQHRKEIAMLYNREIINKKVIKPELNCDSIWLRYTLITEYVKKLHSAAKKRGIILGKWYDGPIAPNDVELSASKYILGNCPNAERLGKLSINLPTNRFITTRDAKRIIGIVNNI